MAVAIFASTQHFPEGLNRLDWITMQATGALAAIGWAFTVSFFLFWLINFISPLRVSHSEEESGLNISEHGAKTELYDLLQDMRYQELENDYTASVRVEPLPISGR
ncbi:hypothetical protein [Endozoicomonas sp. OPT23]|uniref:hypothetical protein n=1 Tax=Endozoicomonas sp. OPT23 TaxID=2072845 RepID=UPI00351AF5ED